MWIREEREFRVYGEGNDWPQEIPLTSYQGGTIEGFSPHSLTIRWYSNVQGWSLGEVQANGKAMMPTYTEDEEGLSRKEQGGETMQGVVIKLVSGANFAQNLPNWVKDAIEKTTPEGLSKFVSAEELGWVPTQLPKEWQAAGQMPPKGAK